MSLAASRPRNPPLATTLRNPLSPNRKVPLLALRHPLVRPHLSLHHPVNPPNPGQEPKTTMTKTPQPVQTPVKTTTTQRQPHRLPRRQAPTQSLRQHRRIQWSNPNQTQHLTQPQPNQPMVAALMVRGNKYPNNSIRVSSQICKLLFLSYKCAIYMHPCTSVNIIYVPTYF